MNVNDMEADAVEGCKLNSIFEHQKELHEKYKPIEIRNGTGFGFVKDREFDIDDRFWQVLLKDFSYRIVEELTESFEAWLFSLEEPGKHEVHVVEELIDALHFITEYCIIVGIQPQQIVPEATETFGGDLLDVLYYAVTIDSDKAPPKSRLYMDVIYELGVASNLLKLRPWKNAHMITDKERYRRHVVLAYRNLICLIADFGLTAVDIYQLYTKKNKVNNWRIGSGY